MTALTMTVTKKTPESAARRWIFWEYGPSYIIRSKPVIKNHRAFFIVDVEFLKQVTDVSTGQPISVPTRLSEIATIEVDQASLDIKAPTIGEVSSQVWIRFRNAQWTLEKQVLRAEKQQYGDLAVAKQMFRPISRIIGQIERKNFARLDNYEKNLKHVELLKRANFVTIDEDMIVPSVMYSVLLERLGGNKTKLESAVLGYLLADQIDYITNVMKINAIRPYSKIPALYYDPAKDLKKIIGIDEDDLYSEFCKSYRMTERDRFDQNIDDLVRNKILGRDPETNQITGNKMTLDFISRDVCSGVRALC